MFSNLARNRHAFGRMFFVSSGAIYDRAHWKPQMAESYFDAHVPVDDYGLSKYLCAKALAGMQRIYELRLFAVFGPMEDWRVRFLSNACCRAIWDMPVVIRQNVFFDFLDVEDLGWIVESLAKRDLRYANYNVCSGRALDLKTLAAMVVKASGKDLGIVVKKECLGVEYSGNNARLLEEIPDFQFRDMNDSVARLYRWYSERKESIDPRMLDFDDR
jgi:GDP-L-fucose synthase